MKLLLLLFFPLLINAHDFIKMSDDDYFLLSDKLSNDIVTEGSNLLEERKKIFKIVIADEKKTNQHNVFS